MHLRYKNVLSFASLLFALLGAPSGLLCAQTTPAPTPTAAPDLPAATPDDEDLPPANNIPGQDPVAPPTEDDDGNGDVPPPIDPSLMIPPAGGGEASGPVGVPQVEGPTPGESASAPDPDASMDKVPQPDSSTRAIIEARRKRYQDRQTKAMFGAYRVHVGASRPRFAWNNTYTKHYGNPSIMPVLGVDYFAFDWFVTLGLAFRFGYYKDTGYALKRENGNLVQDKAGKTVLTLAPFQVSAAAEMTPFPAKWIVLSGWAGFEYLFFQELRDQSTTKKNTTTTSTSTTSLAASDASTDETGGLFMTKGWRKSSVVGLGVSFRLDWADGQAAGSLSTMGLRSIYVTPFVEAVTAIDKEKANFARKVMGVLFTFESIN